MPIVSVKFKYGPLGKSANISANQQIQVSKKPPTESEVLAALRKAHPKREIVILEVK